MSDKQKDALNKLLDLHPFLTLHVRRYSTDIYDVTFHSSTGMDSKYLILKDGIVFEESNKI